jgi:glycosyltransferase involved in cell wall biosynthesis
MFSFILESFIILLISANSEIVDILLEDKNFIISLSSFITITYDDIFAMILVNKLESIFFLSNKLQTSSILLLIGEGEESEKIKDLVRQKHLSNKVIFTGPVNNVHEYLSAMDIFLFPSLWEGLGIALIEAQQNGLRCLVSENIPETADMGLCRVASLDEDKSVWAQRIMELLVLKRGEPDRKIMEYDIKRVSQNLQNLYLSGR